ncbi:MAG TPA: carboxypeptidase regulatory-like domain-containing protein [Terriglobales bacterium]|jgi:outer membrane receptor for ferrienterochelin and colicin|nr:carboxypeptidase regulatory-like domain-containing protein [Terriglobales bacterium]
MRRLQFCLAVFAILALACSAFAQVQNGQVAGTVLDPSGAAIANATVTVTNPATNFSSSATTNASGNYTVKEVPIGTYKVTVEAAGFKTVTNTGVPVNAGTISHVDSKMTMGQKTEIVEVTGAVALVNTEDSKLASTVSSTQINNLPLNGRNVFDLMQLSAGAVNVAGVDFENGHQTVVNGLREDFNGFLVNGVSNKGLSGGAVNVPIQDTVEEFQQLQLNMSAQYGNSAGGSVNLVTKSGTNSWHGSAWEYLRNDALDANLFFLNQSGVKKPPVRFNQFGVTLGGPIMKDKLFFFLSLQGNRYKATAAPINDTQETTAFRDAVIQADANANAGLGVDGQVTNSTAALLYHDFAPANTGTDIASAKCGAAFSADCYFGLDLTQGIAPNYSGALCLDNGFGTFTTLQHQKLINIFGVTAQDQTDMTNAGCSNIPGVQAGALTSRSIGIKENSVATFKTQLQSLGNLFNGNEASLRVDYNWNASNRFFVNYNYNRQTDSFGPCNVSCTRGFGNPLRNNFPQGSLSFVHTFSPTILNEFRAGYLQNNTVIKTNHGGVPQAAFTDKSAGFGSYNGYPQSFKENIYTYSDLVSISHGNHNMKVGVDFRRNIENSEFNVARPSYYFYDQVFFAADAPYYQAAGVDPGICKAPCPSSSYNQAPTSQLSSNFRHWRNLEMGAFFQDDWKVTKRLTLNLGMRYDLYQRHHDAGNVATTFILGDSTPNDFIVGPSSGIINRLYNTSNPATCVNAALAQVVDGCGLNTHGTGPAGGFAPSSNLGAGDHNNFGPRIGFAWDVFGDGKTSVRGGFGVAYEGTLYNPLSNSRWDPPYYSFNGIAGGVGQAGQDIVWGPSTCGGGVCNQDPTTPVNYTSNPGTNPNQGPVGQAQNAGNIIGWDSNNPNFAVLTGIILPGGIKDPYVYNYYFSVQREILPKTVVEARYVGTTGHKLFRAEDINREPGALLPAGTTVVDNFGRTLHGLGSRPNANFGRLRTWENVVNSSYSSLQASVKRQMSHGLLFNADYTYSHSIDNGSTWHSGATTANGSAAGEGFTTDQTLPGLDRGNSIYDIRHRLVLNYVWQLPGQNMKGIAGVIAGGWSLNGIWAFQSGAHWEPYTAGRRVLKGDCSQSGIDAGLCVNIGGDFNLDRGRNDRPDSSVPRVSGVSHDAWANGWGIQQVGTTTTYTTTSPGLTISSPCLGCSGNLGRNTFVGPGYWTADMTLSKTFKITERVNVKFDANAFNIFNRTNFILATAGGGANNTYFHTNALTGAFETTTNFGQAAGTLNARNMQLGLKVSF